MSNKPVMDPVYSDIYLTGPVVREVIGSVLSHLAGECREII